VTEGVLILVAGPSGAGKDTLIRGAREYFSGDPRLIFVKRLITQESRTGEDHLPVTPKQFRILRENGGFFLHWQAHGLSYALPANILDHLKAGRCAVANVSRAMIGEARLRWPQTRVILIEANPGVLQLRLEQRGRENARQIEERVRRSAAPACRVAPPVHLLDNSGSIETGVRSFTRLLSQLTAPVCGTLSQS
jgi:ribose 1,5-bisphosphokinase